VKASWLFNNLKINQYAFSRKIVYVNGQACYLSASKIKNRKGALELQIIVSFVSLRLRASCKRVDLQLALPVKNRKS